ncbi:MAG TPA: L,D-transpeptidase [Marmoricola sp.]|jgi:lipoprotein-anchoring transpeptidase ErfK/SrfK|nr:L,D-transpeptidase [Marmoricola sp.]
MPTPPGGRRRAGPRYGRIGAAGFSLVVTAVALLAGLGVIPVGPAPAAPDTVDMTAAHALAADAAQASALHGGRPAPVATVLPTDSGHGKRVVFSIDEQRVWLVGGRDRVLSTYLVSGSLTDNLKPGSYAVYSRSRWAVGIDDSGVMQYFVRFTHGKNAAIGFHSIPTKDGKPLQAVAELGTPTSHGCIRQRLEDARRLWSFAPEGTPVVVTA